jgi:hypothetical protein
MARDDVGQRKGSPLLPACKLYQKTSANGRGYLIGRLGGLRVLIMPKRDNEEGEHTHNLLLSEASSNGEREGRA